jgi:hypothetical protein
MTTMNHVEHPSYQRQLFDDIDRIAPHRGVNRALFRARNRIAHSALVSEGLLIDTDYTSSELWSLLVDDQSVGGHKLSHEKEVRQLKRQFQRALFGPDASDTQPKMAAPTGATIRPDMSIAGTVERALVFAADAIVEGVPDRDARLKANLYLVSSGYDWIVVQKSLKLHYKEAVRRLKDQRDANALFAVLLRSYSWAD